MHHRSCATFTSAWAIHDGEKTRPIAAVFHWAKKGRREFAFRFGMGGDSTARLFITEDNFGEQWVVRIATVGGQVHTEKLVPTVKPRDTEKALVLATEILVAFLAEYA